MSVPSAMLFPDINVIYTAAVDDNSGLLGARTCRKKNKKKFRHLLGPTHYILNSALWPVIMVIAFPVKRKRLNVNIHIRQYTYQLLTGD